MFIEYTQQYQSWKTRIEAFEVGPQCTIKTSDDEINLPRGFLPKAISGESLQLQESMAALNYALDYIACQECQAFSSFDVAMEVFQIAEIMQLQGLKDRCEGFLKHNPKTDCLKRVYEFAQKNDLKDLMVQCQLEAYKDVQNSIIQSPDILGHETSDLTIRVGKREFHVHKRVLMHDLEYLRRTLSEGGEAYGQSYIELMDAELTAELMAELIDYLYKGKRFVIDPELEVGLIADRMESLAFLADFFKLEDLTAQCIAYLGSLPKNDVDSYGWVKELAQRHNWDLD